MKQDFGKAATNRILDALFITFGFAAGICTIGGAPGSHAALQAKNYPSLIMANL